MNAVEVRNLSKKFTHYPSQRDRLIDMATGGRAKRGTDFWALKDISFDVPQGTTFGIIGQNGSGKSTLLSILAGVLQPTSGTFTVNGKVAAILELGSGFHHEFTGRENVYMYAAILGLSRLEIDRRLDEIIDFSELHEFIDRPLYTYSSGMVARLAFAVAVNVDADILIIDEALAVGDMFFQAKCISKMRNMIDSEATVILVSHDVAAIKSLCDQCLFLDHGKLLYCGKPDKTVEEYCSLEIGREQNIIKNSQHTLDNTSDSSKDHEFQKRASVKRIQNGRAYFGNIQLLNENYEEIFLVRYEQNVVLRMIVEMCEDIPIIGFGYVIRDTYGIDVAYSDSVIENNNLFLVKRGERYSIDWGFKASLKQGCYYITSAVSIPTSNVDGKPEFCDYVPYAVRFKIEEKEGAKLYGLIHWDNSLKIEKC